jgi:stage II sporulation protein D
LRISAIAAFLCLFSTSAFAEEEVRISLFADKKEVAVSGKSLAIYDAEVGDRIATGDSALVAKDGLVEVVAAKKVVARAKSVIVEAKGGVRVASGVYLGRIEVSTGARGALSVINRLPLETYLLGIIGSEMSPEWPIEALKAQAVAARTYAMQRHMMMRAANKPYDLESSVISQVYKGAERIRPSVIRAVKETRGEVVAHRHGLAEALFHSTCGGKTASAKSAFGREVAYLSPRTCKWCRDSTRYSWKLEMPLAQVASKLGRYLKGADDLERKDGASSVTLKAKRTEKKISPRQVREALGYTTLYSERFTAETKGKKVEIHGSGFGHGVGMCQWGARGMAVEGKTYREILEHYYFGAGLKRIY